MAELEGSLGSFEDAYVDLDIDGMGYHRERAVGILACLDGPVPSSTSARFHRMEGIYAIEVQGDEGAATLYFASARASDPNYDFPADLVPSNAPLRDVYQDLSPSAVAVAAAAPTPASGTLYVDGVATDQRPLARPAILQLVGGEDAFNRYLRVNDALPTYTVEGEEIDEEVRGDPGAAPLGPVVMTAAGVGVAGFGVGWNVWHYNYFEEYYTAETGTCHGWYQGDVEGGDCADSFDRLGRNLIIGWGAVGFGAAAAVGGLVWWSPWSGDVAVAPVPGGLILRGRF